MPITKTYLLLAGTKIPVGRCSAVLPNSLQCWRAGDVQVIEQTTVPATESVPEHVDEKVYQLCNRHAVIQKQQDAADAAKAEADAVAIAEAAAKKQEVQTVDETPTTQSTENVS